MPLYSYKAKNLEGKKQSGILDAQSVAHLAKILRQKGYFLLFSKEQSIEKKKKPFIKQLDIFERFAKVPLNEKLFFTRNLAIMIKTGVPLPRAFEILSKQTRTKILKIALKKISESIIKGDSLSEALGFFPKIFPKLYRETLKVGEETGRIEESLNVLSVQMEKEYSLKSHIKTAMAYPLIVLVLAFLIGILMFLFVVPKMQDAFRELEIELPLITRLLLSFSDFLVSHLLVFGLISLILIIILVSFLKSKIGKRLRDSLVLKVPLISKIIRQVNSALALRTLSSLLGAGVPIVRSLEVASGSLGNFYFRQSLENAAAVVEKGKKLSEALRPYQNLYLPMVLEMLKVGEETGETSKILAKLADFYEEEVAAATKKLSSVIEPFLIIIVGGAIGFFAIAMLQPIFSIGSRL